MVCMELSTYISKQKILFEKLDLMYFFLNNGSTLVNILVIDGFCLVCQKFGIFVLKFRLLIYFISKLLFCKTEAYTLTLHSRKFRHRNEY